jgi:hypothetical protein
VQFFYGRKNNKKSFGGRNILTLLEMFSILAHRKSRGRIAMAFERWTKRRRIYAPMAALWARGHIGFNVGAVEKYDLKRFTYAVLFYDPDTERIGIKFTAEENETGSVKIVHRSQGASISARLFLEYYNVKPTETKQYTFSYDKDNDLYVIDLKNK